MLISSGVRTTNFGVGETGEELPKGREWGGVFEEGAASPSPSARGCGGRCKLPQ